MSKITFIGAGSMIFAKNVLGDCLMTPALNGSMFALYDINEEKLRASENMLNNINRNNGCKSQIRAFNDRRMALENADYVINAIHVGGYNPCTINDFEIPLKYGLKQTFADTLGIGGIFRGLRTIPVVLEIAKEMEEVCPNAWFLNYTNPMAIITGAMLKATQIKTVGLCHSVQVCAKNLLLDLGMDAEGISWQIAGINHQAWLLNISKNKKDLYPEIKRRALLRPKPHNDMVRYEIMKRFGYYVTESSTHNAEYLPYFIKNKYPEITAQFNIPIGEYKNWGNDREEYWESMKKELVENKKLTHKRTEEYVSYIIEAMETNVPYKFNGNVLNKGLIKNLSEDACVELPCLIDSCGIIPCYIGELPLQCAAINQTNINVQLLTIEAALTHKKEHVYHAALLDPHTAAELTIDNIIAMCDEMLEANADFLPEYK